MQKGYIEEQKGIMGCYTIGEKCDTVTFFSLYAKEYRQLLIQ